MNKFTRGIIRHSGLVTLLGLMVTLLAAQYTVELYKNLRPDIEELLPTTSRSVVDLNEVTSRLESIDNITVLIFSDDVVASRRFVEDLATELGKVPKGTLAWVEYRINKEIDFFKKRRALYLSVEDIAKVRNYVRDRIEYEKTLYNPLTIFSEQEIPEPKLNYYEIAERYSGKIAYYTKFPDGYYATQDEKIRVLLAYMPGKVSGIGGAERLRGAIDQAVARLDPKKYAPDLEVKFSGGVQNLIEEHRALVSDLGTSSLIVIILVTVAMLVYFQSFLLSFTLIVSLFAGTLWTLGLTYIWVGYLNANSAFLGAIIVGNGINFGIILLARYLEERRKRRNHVRSLSAAMSGTLSATLVAALAAATSYGSLMLTGFRGFNQFGLIGLMGMILCWVSAYTLLPALLTVLFQMRWIQTKRWPESKKYFAKAVAYFVSRWPKTVIATSCMLTIASLATFTQFGKGIIEADLEKLRSKESFETGSAALSKYSDQVFERYMIPIVYLPDNIEDAREIAKRLRDKEEAEGDENLIDIISFIEDFVPGDQPRKIAMLKEIQSYLTPLVLQEISPKEKKLIREFLTPEVFHTFTLNDLPELLLNRFREKDGTIGKLVLLEPPITPLTRNADHLTRFIREVREVGDSVRAETPVAGQLAVSSDLIEAIQQDGPRATLFAFIAVILLVVPFFRNIRMISLVLSALMIGVLWVFGIILGFGFKVNFVNFIALPMTFGIGVDYAVNIFERYRKEHKGSILKVIKETGGAVALASFTTIVGYSSLLLATNQGFVSFGQLSVMGEFTCLFTALLTVPAWIYLRDRKTQSRFVDAPPALLDEEPQVRPTNRPLI